MAVFDVGVLALDESLGEGDIAALLADLQASRSTAVGVSRGPLSSRFDALGEALLLSLVPEADESARWQVGVEDVDVAAQLLQTAITHAPTATQVLDRLLRITAMASIEDGLTAESLAYSMLMAGAEHRRWLSTHSRKPIPEPAQPPILLERTDAVLRITLNRPERHNAFGAAVRDGLAEAFDLVALDPSIERVELRGAGRSFCSGGDLDEFGLTEDVALAHLIRVDRSVAARIARVADRVGVELHGACIGAGIELASYASRVTAHPDAVIRLPEVAMGLIPGAGGTVGITKRIGRWRTAYLAVTGVPLDLPTALRWGLVDDLA
ncbi:MAG TPA: enoyl-CoA hydratase/isomerase family protein [Jatrophihabitans sp.]